MDVAERTTAPPPSSRPASILTCKSTTMRGFGSIKQSAGCSGIFASHNRWFQLFFFLHLVQKSFDFMVPNTHWFHIAVEMKISLVCKQPHSGWLIFPLEGMMSCVWLPSKRVREARLGSLRCHSPVQCCLNMIRQGSTVKRLKA